MKSGPGICTRCGHHLILHCAFVGNGGELKDQFPPSNCTFCKCVGFTEVSLSFLDPEAWRNNMLVLCEGKPKKKKKN